jgi:hypothetical protein
MSPRRSKKKGKQSKKRRKGRRSSGPERREVRLDELRAILERARSAPLSAADHELLTGAVETLAFITQELEQSELTIARLRKLLFGSSSEKTRDVVGEADDDAKTGEADDDATTDDAKADSETDTEATDDASETAEKKKRKGHGKNGADAYTGAERVSVKHDTLKHGDRCPGCLKGKVYRQKPPAVLVRVRGIAPLSATVYELERLRCNLCGEVFTAPAPPGVGDRKYDETAAAMIALLKYGCGLPFNRMRRLGDNLGVPLPAATQWDVVKEAAEACEPAWAELISQAAAGDVVYIDDTNATVLSLIKQIEAELAAGETDRTGIFTSGVVSTVEGRKLAIFFTGREHAGENLAKVLAHRSEALPPPIQMSDALSRNTSPGDFETILASCVVHARRKFVDVVGSFPDEVAHVLETLRDVYRYDAEARDAQMSPDERLRHHQEHSKPLMDGLAKWLQAQFDDKLVEPNSTLGGAIRYMQNHWDKLTLFLRVPGAPLDNNLAERVLKRAILHRKNSLFYKTDNGAHVGDVFMSLIHTAELCGTNPFDYLVALQRHSEAVAASPAEWMPWNYEHALAALADERAE